MSLHGELTEKFLPKYSQYIHGGTALRGKFFLLGVVIFVLLCFPLVVSVNAASMWSRTYGGTGTEHAYSLVATSDGGYAIAGSTSSFGVGNGDAWLVKTDALGNMQWNHTYGGGGWDYAYSLVVTPDGGYAIAGVTQSFSHNIYEDAWLVKTDASGNMQWNKTYGGESWDGAYSLIVTSDGGYALAGYTTPVGEGWNLWLIKTDSLGNSEWSRTYGGTGDDVARSLIATPDGGYALAGGISGGDFWLVKTDSLGNKQWDRTYGGQGYEIAYSLIATSDGGYALAGAWNASIYEPSFGAIEPPGEVNGQCWLVKTDALGQMQWNRTYGGAGSDLAYSLIQTSDEGYALAGAFNYTDIVYFEHPEYSIHTGDCLLVKTDASGNIAWNQTYGGEAIDIAYSLLETSDGGYALAGDIGLHSDTGGDLWLIKTDELGVVPEYSSWLIPALVMTATAFILINKKRLLHKRS
jgi:hypothetical protein